MYIFFFGTGIIFLTFEEESNKEAFPEVSSLVGAKFFCFVFCLLTDRDSLKLPISVPYRRDLLFDLKKVASKEDFF